ncbi:MAG TPA: hypothetical protein VFJ67_06975 [Thermodesulfobacteriota bacterium]|nr:hypothetical protein [Thermodesulfobacteriota bacterium]
MRHILRGITALALLSLLLPAAFAGDYTVETYTSGVLSSEPGIKSALIGSGEELAEAKEALGITAPLPGVDFGKEALLLILSPEGSGGIIEVTGAVPAEGALEVRYRVKSEGPAPMSGTKTSYPYLMAKINPAPADGVPVRFIDEDYANSLASGTGLGQFSEYTNVLSGSEESEMTEFLPLDKGNSWTYITGEGGEESEVTNSVVSESDGWSVFDSFFGLSGVGMKISPGGEVFVSSGGGIKTFYTPDVVTEFRKGPVNTPAGAFSNVMVVTIPEGGGFWFMDVYAKGVGLITHEQNSRKGRVSYRLVRAVVGGKEYPRPDNGRATGNK